MVPPGSAVATGRAQYRKGERWIVPVLLLAPSGAIICILFAATLIIWRLSFGLKNHESMWTFQSYVDMGQRLYLQSVFLTFRLAFVSTVIAVILALPIAMFLARTESRWMRRSILFVLLLPLLMNLLLQAYGWMVLMAPAGMLSRLLEYLRLARPPVLLIFSATGVLIGLVHGSLAVATLPIVSALRNIPVSLEEASAVLGANRFRTFCLIILPLSLPGIVSSSLLVFAWNVSAFVIPYLLGGGRVPVLAVLINDQMGPFLNWPLGSALSIVLVITTVVILSAYQAVLNRYQRSWYRSE